MSLHKDSLIVKKTIDSLTVSVDPRLELLAAVQIRADYPFLSPYDFEYKKKMQGHFKEFREFEAVRMQEEMLNNGFAYHVPVEIMLHCSEDLYLDKMITDPHVIRACDGYENIKRFIDAIRLYRKETKFDKFYLSNIDFYKQIVEQTADKLADYKVVPWLEDFYGYKQGSCNLILSPVFINGGYGPRIKNKEDKYDCYSVIGTMNVKNNNPIFFIGARSEDYSFDESIFLTLIWHEFGHSYVNPLTSEYIEQVYESVELYAPIAEALGEQAYGDWESAINEHIIDAISLKLTEMYLKKKDAAKLLEVYKERRSFLYIYDIYDKLDEYISNRQKYPTFREFYPEILKLFNSLLKKQ